MRRGARTRGTQRGEARSRRQARAGLAATPVRRRRCDRGRQGGRDRSAGARRRPSRRWWSAASCASATGIASCRCSSSTGRSPTAAGRCTRWLCQARLEVVGADGSPVFVRRPIDAISLAPAVDRVELAGLEMQYRANVELAVGHGVGVAGRPRPPRRPDRGMRLQTAVDAGRGGPAAPRRPGPPISTDAGDPRAVHRRAGGAGHADAQRGDRRGASRVCSRRWPTRTRRGSTGRSGGSPTRTRGCEQLRGHRARSPRRRA